MPKEEKISLKGNNNNNNNNIYSIFIYLFLDFLVSPMAGTLNSIAVKEGEHVIKINK